ncbi:YbhB/YbcL family Raf kinase inhibitor-like protein [Citrobacter amalonaticus]|uniref:YbhB/YbcL family Raf kinase inhibitor-like protein n=1 Tax=Citrobacter amalonaticus TaxID=35703 RepID=A0A2S4RY86_CITAM|nr:YbhB/YbcL family Raf kinase inhibitor-like protein [Citrobacter amalonaticus]POT57864.1 YbhB/YbcL family Raf kinase inhibitor-like protein [Citrobacter amalonaticus]POT76609.1 YbhB/YbcL family Raf kinase inhibitor-like protein [Citrobacter amalonaticus]POU65688.1 YbhB/YbcL family Raf kinase inhibitor-like protein [Citrobacter amalonaticus]POV05845.1 YbhB/YbcL family Raf kinase inhibitor-like protein [Citrobacter amalonaticus]
MKTVSSLTAIVMMVLSFSVSAAPVFSLNSTDIPQDLRLTQKQVFNGFGCSGENLSPQLNWQNPPTGTKSFAITLFDPDAPTGSGWWHWTVVNIPAQHHALAAGMDNAKLPAGAVQGRNDFGYAGFGGACPPAGDKAHRYTFTVWALNTASLPIDSTASGALVGFMLNSHVIAKAELTTTYGR